DPDFALGEAGTVRSGNDGAFIGYGAMVTRAMEAAEILADDGMEITVINARFAKPLDHRTLRTVIEEHPAVIVAEDHVRPGGFGAAVLEEMTELGVDTRGLHLAHAPDRFVEHASREEQLAELKLNGAGLAERMRETLG
ncbi:MAG: transketolase C-terminal domain-containing protein, partial [Planctomycetota bacterium]